MLLNEDIVKQLFFYSDRPRQDAALADDVDIVQLANNVEAFVRVAHQRTEHARCVAIVSEMNPDVGRALANQRPG